jgi:hypothetical protein
MVYLVLTVVTIITSFLCCDAMEPGGILVLTVVTIITSFL